MLFSLSRINLGIKINFLTYPFRSEGEESFFSKAIENGFSYDAIYKQYEVTVFLFK